MAQNLRNLYDIGSRENLRGKAFEGFIRPTLKQFFTSLPNFEEIEHDSFSDYDTVFYVETTGNDTTGDGSKTTPYRTITKAANESVNYTAIVVGDGEFLFTEFVDEDITIHGNNHNTFLDIGFSNNSITMTNYNTFINLTVKNSWSSDRTYMYIYNLAFPKLLFKNVLFETVDGTNPYMYPIFTNNNGSGTWHKDVYYEYCTFESLFTHVQNSYAETTGYYSNCVARNEFIVDSNNLLNATLGIDFEVTSENSSNMGIYGGEYGW